MPDKMSSEKFDIRQTFHSEMSGENSKCRRRIVGSPDKMSGKAQMNFAYSAFIIEDGDIFVFTQPLRKCEKIVEMGKKLNFSKTQPTKPLYKSMKKKQQKPFGRFS